MAEKKGESKTLKIMACRQVYSGRNGRGDQYTIYEIDAQNEQGITINQKLRSFVPLPIGQTVEVEVTLFNSEQHGKSYTLHPKGATRSNSGQQLNEIREELDQYKGMIASLSERVGRLEVAQGTVAPAAPATPVPGDAPDSALTEQFGDDAPW